MKQPTIIFFLCLFAHCYSQTTDLAISVEAQDIDGNNISEVNIYQEFQYVVTISNSGNDVDNVIFSQVLNPQVEVLSFESLNPAGGAIDATDLNLSTNNELTGTTPSMPTSSSLQIKVVLKAPLFAGGIGTNASITPPDGTTDVNLSNNQSIISIEVTDVDLDFTVDFQQISPSSGNPISSWGDNVTYQFTISNNSIIDYPLDKFSLLSQLLSSSVSGNPKIQVQSLNCISSSGGVDCPMTIDVSSIIITVGSISNIYNYNQNILFPSGSSLTFELVYKYLQPDCVELPETIEIDNFVRLELNPNIPTINSDNVTTILVEAEQCLLTDVEITTTVIEPSPSLLSSWDDLIVLQTEVTNNGPLDIPIRFFLQNLTSDISSWDIISVNCLNASGGLSCSDINYELSGEFWNSNNFTIPTGATVITETILKYIEPVCTPNTQTYDAQIRSAINLLSDTILDSNPDNNFDDDFIQLLPTNACPASDLEVEKMQIFPELPVGGSSSTPMEWQEVTYEITVTNMGTEDTFMILKDERLSSSTNSTAILQSVNCVSASGGAICENISTQNIGLEITNSSDSSILWEIVEDDAWEMPSGASVTFQATVEWLPECDNEPIEVKNRASVEAIIGALDNNNTNDSQVVSSYFTPCVDLVVQTLPSSPTVSINSEFNWIVDITNSETSSNAVDTFFENILNNEYTITDTPTCQVASGIADCITSFNVVDNLITGVIPNMEAGSTVRITIPVTSPNFGGAFNNIAEATPSPQNNEEVTPETNISISSAQVIAPTLQKAFNPDLVFINELSTLTFTVTNINTNPSQNNIVFIDNLPDGIVLSGAPFWEESNGCTADFLGNTGDTFTGIFDLTFPEGVESCSFSVLVTSNTSGSYLNQAGNFSDQNNIDTSQASASLEVIEDNSNVDIEIIKDVSPEVVSIEDEVTFTITATNLGTTIANNIEVVDILPTGYSFISEFSTSGVFISNVWSIPILNSNQSEELTINAKVLSTGDYLNIALLQSVQQTDRDPNNNEDSAEVLINNCLNIPGGFSPNEDSFNDYFVIPCIDDYPNNNIKIFNRYGTLLFEENNYKNNWNGKANRGFPKGNLLPTGTYFYVIMLDDNDKKTGWIYLNY